MDDWQAKHGMAECESDTDTEVIAKLMKHVYDTTKSKNLNFREIVELTVQQLVSLLAAYVFYPTCVTCMLNLSLIITIKLL